jgi:hypothetical protein
MKKRNNQFNTKRKIRSVVENDAAVNAILAKKVGYGGNPEHKKNPGDFGLTPPSGPRPGKSLCDQAGIFSRAEALKYVKLGLKKGLVSDRFTGEWPQNIWAVTNKGIPLEAQLENPILGTYHGYPMPASDPLAEEVIKRWKAA